MIKHKKFMGLGLSTLLVSGAVSAGGMMMQRGMMMHGGTARQHQIMMGGVPAPYGSLRNPIPASETVVEQGAKLYQTYCASCHGQRGDGDGPAARQLSPPPANLRQTLHMGMMAGDGYLMWTLSEGGKPFNTAMPPFKSVLAEDDRWKIIDFLRTL